MTKRFSPGEKAPRSGPYKNTSTGLEVTVVRNAPLPPTPRKGQAYTLVDPTKHKKS